MNKFQQAYLFIYLFAKARMSVSSGLNPALAREWCCCCKWLLAFLGPNVEESAPYLNDESSRATRQELSKDSALVPSYFTAALPPLLHTSPLVIVQTQPVGYECMCVCVCIHVFTHIQRPQVGITYVQQLFPPQLLRQGLSLCSEFTE